MEIDSDLERESYYSSESEQDIENDDYSVSSDGWSEVDGVDKEHEEDRKPDEVVRIHDGERKMAEQDGGKKGIKPKAKTVPTKRPGRTCLLRDSQDEDEDMREPDEMVNKSDDELKGSGGDGEKNSKTHKAKTVQGKRPLRKCPIKGCEAEVVDLPRHLRGVHGWSKEMSRKATSRYGMRKSFLPKPVKKKSESDDSKKIDKDYHRHRSCPIEGCKSVVKHLSAHLRQVHRDIPVGSPLYKKTLKEAGATKTCIPSKKAKCSRSEMDTLHSPSDQSEKEVEMTNNTGPSDVPSNNEELEIMELADVGFSNEEQQLDVMFSFCSWLQSADGGRKDPKLSKQHASQLSRILEIIDPTKNLRSLFRKSLLRDIFLKHAETKYTADTIKVYLLSLRHFCSYVTSEKPECVDVDPALVSQIAEKARLWSMSSKKYNKRRHLEKMNKDLNNLVTPDMINGFERSESARSVVGYIEKLTGAHSLVVNQAVYTLIRDFLLLEIAIANAHRSGMLANMTVGEFKAAKEKQDTIFISVKKHKTADTHGPARVVLSPTLFSYLQVYFNEVRSRVLDSTSNENESDEAYVFLSWNGAKMESGQICTAINAALEKGGMQGHILSTLFRKSAVTNVHARHNELRSDLADLMAHKETTAQILSP